MECLDCHDGMFQEHTLPGDQTSYLYLGVSTSASDNYANGVYVNSTLTKTGANWEPPRAWEGLLLFPDVVNDWSMYYITGEHLGHDYREGSDGHLGRSTSFAITYRMMISEQVPYQPDRWYQWGGNVRFFQSHRAEFLCRWRYHLRRHLRGLPHADDPSSQRRLGPRASSLQRGTLHDVPPPFRGIQGHGHGPSSSRSGYSDGPVHRLSHDER